MIQEREVLSHEIGHIITDTADNIYISKWDEQRADVAWREFLINAEEVISLIEENEWVADAQLFASYFGVSVETMEKRIREIFNLSI